MNQIEDEQAIRAALRVRFLNIISRLSGKDSKIEMYEQSTVTCKVAACDSAFENIVVDNLKTPSKMVLDKAILRTEDIISMHFVVDVCTLSNE